MQTDNWYVLHVLTGKEQDVIAAAHHLEGVTALSPLEAILERHGDEWKDVIRHIFPGYVFVQVERLDAKRYYQFKRINGVIRLLGLAAGDIPRTVPAEEMQAIIDMCDGGGSVIGLSTGERMGNGRIKIIDGPLTKFPQDDIKKIDTRQCRAVVDIHLLNRTHTVTLGIKILPTSSQTKPEAEAE